MKTSTEDVLSDYEKVWEEFEAKSDFKSEIVRHSSARSEYLAAIEKYLSGLIRPRIMELGCGTAIDLNIIASRNRRLACYGSDISPKSVSIGRRTRDILGNRVEYVVSDTRALPVRANSLDVIFSQGLVEHFRNPFIVVEEQLRALRNGGFLIINVPQRYTGYTIMKRKLMREGKWKLGWETEFSYQDLKKIGRHFGLSEREVFGYQYWMSWKEPLFVLRDLYDKLHRRNPFKDLLLFRTIREAYDAIWNRLERKWGHYFLQNIVIVFQKKNP